MSDPQSLCDCGFAPEDRSLELSLIMTSTFQAKLLFVFADSAVGSTVFLLVSCFSHPLGGLITNLWRLIHETMFLHSFCR